MPSIEGKATRVGASERGSERVSKMTDFRRVDNLVFSFASTDTDLKTGKVLEKVTVHEITLNPPVPESFFDTLKEI